MADILCKIQISFVFVFVYFGIFAAAGKYLCPSACSCLGSMVDCSQRRLEDIPLDLPTWVEILDLSNNKIKEVPLDVFEGLIILEEINLSNNKIEHIEKEIFDDIPKLKKLELSYNELEEFPSFPEKYNLTHLVLSHNRIRSLNTASLEQLPQLRLLDVGFNRITILQNGTFPFLPNLHQLYANNNRIGQLVKGCFDNLINLEWLKLGKNHIQNLSAHIFIRLKKLKQLDLNRNKLEMIVGLTFEGLENLAVLKMKRNNISQLSDGGFWGLQKITSLELDSNSLTYLNKNGLYGLDTLKSMSLTNNHIKDIEEGAWEFCPHLTTLDLSNNAMVRINTNTFSKLSSMHSLYMNNNNISYIGYKAFSDLSSLQTLEMNTNQISWTIEDMHGPFEGLWSLQKLALRWNQIKSVTAQSFQGLEELRVLDLGYNQISTLQNDCFANLKELQQLHMNTSALLCDCKLEWLQDWLQDTNFLDSVATKCAHPKLLHGIDLLDVEEFTCDDDNLKPVIVNAPKSQIALKGGNITLHCIAASSSSSPMNIEWRKDNDPVTHAKVNTTATMVEEAVNMTSVLVIRNAQFEDAGAYQCVAENEVGPTYSSKVEINVHVFPVFTKEPSDQTVRSGTRVELECAAMGQPAPEISWQKDGGVDFPAARERRMHVQPDNDIFFISSVKLEDMGLYSCTASNAAGTVVTNATLTVLVKPQFEQPMQDLEVEAGETAVLECMAQGNPMPRLQWLKDDHPLELTERHFFTAEEQLLIIVSSQEEDTGKYTCVMTNTLGSNRGSLQLKIASKGKHGAVSIFGGDPNGTTTGIIIIAVVCCVVGTSLIWVVIIYQTRRKNEEYSSTPTEETTIPEVAYNTADGTNTRTIYTAQGAYSRVYANGGHHVNGGVHMNGGFNITRNPMDSEADWEAGQGEYEQNSQEHLISSSHIPCSRGSSVSIVSESHSSSSSPGTQSTQSTMLHMSTFHPHLNRSQSNTAEEVINKVADLPTRHDIDPGGVEQSYTSSQEGSSPSCSTFPRPHNNFVHKTSSCSHLQQQPPQISIPTTQTPQEPSLLPQQPHNGSQELDSNHNSKPHTPHIQQHQDCNSNPSHHPQPGVHTNGCDTKPVLVVHNTKLRPQSQPCCNNVNNNDSPTGGVRNEVPLSPHINVTKSESRTELDSVDIAEQKTNDDRQSSGGDFISQTVNTRQTDISSGTSSTTNNNGNNTSCRRQLFTDAPTVVDAVVHPVYSNGPVSA